ncbi:MULTISPECIES: recombinase family protein [unclassified Bacillus cereus group]|uniref:recombinase family protein n=1 Tax=unclassified Bacillus cereus group TaxID=2750818 RepID=UPI001F570E26|nr:MULTISPECIES: recombinase family protein [unclassified Bacillus cereus group]
MKTAIYLRKSRADIEAEQRGEGETLAKHRTALLKVAKEKNLNIIAVHEEIVSGESLVHRPEMLKLLQDVENNKYDVVLCMDMDRLGRGGMKEQGIILETFKRSNTKIMTPRKTYDLNDEWDEEYSEFEAFMARKELKIITRRMQRGRIASVEAGNYISTNPPYGYVIKKIKNGRTLEPHPEQAEVVKLIFEWYTHDDPEIRIGASMIANKLNTLGYKTAKGKTWGNWTVLGIIKNIVYCGKVTWKKKEIKKSTTPGKVKDTRTRDTSEWIVVDGKHEALISEELFEKAQAILKGRYHVPYQLINGVKSPLAGIVKCAKCGASMVYRPYTTQKPALKCYNQTRCHNKSSNYELVEQRILEGLAEWLEIYKANFEANTPEEASSEVKQINVYRQMLKNLEKELTETEKQKEKLFDLLERGIYTDEMFLNRSKSLSAKTEKLQQDIDTVKESINSELQREEAQENIIPQVERVLDLYTKTDDPKKKNSLLKSVLEKAVYNKEKHQYKDDFTLTLYPKLPK